jgi:hypothetical protein
VSRLKFARMYRQDREADTSAMGVDYMVLVGGSEVRIELAPFTHEEYASAMAEAGLRATFDPDGLGRNLLVDVTE